MTMIVIVIKHISVCVSLMPTCVFRCLISYRVSRSGICYVDDFNALNVRLCASAFLSEFVPSRVRMQLQYCPERFSIASLMEPVSFRNYFLPVFSHELISRSESLRKARKIQFSLWTLTLL